jgi:hypothetical protein
MLAEDLRRMGVKPEPMHAAAQIAGSQYYLLMHDNPALLLGYMLTLEVRALDSDMVGRIEKIHNLRLECLRHHAENDARHASEIMAQIKKQPDDVQKKIMWNADCVLRSLVGTFDAIWANVGDENG